MNAEDFIRGIKEFNTLGTSEKDDLLGYFLLQIKGQKSITSKEIWSLCEDLRLPSTKRLPQYLSENSKGKKSKYVKLKQGYALNREFIQTLDEKYAKRKSAVHVSQELVKLYSGIGDPKLKDYLAEAISCFENDLLRTAIIMSWISLYYLIREWTLANHLAAFNVITSSWKKPVTISIAEDFNELKEAVVLDALHSAKIVTKEIWKTLKILLDQRNSYAHPSNKPTSPAITEAYIVTIIKEVFPALK